MGGGNVFFFNIQNITKTRSAMFSYLVLGFRKAHAKALTTGQLEWYPWNLTGMTVQMGYVEGQFRILNTFHQRIELFGTGFLKSLDILQSWDDPGSCSPSAYVMIFSTIVINAVRCFDKSLKVFWVMWLTNRVFLVTIRVFWIIERVLWILNRVF